MHASRLPPCDPNPRPDPDPPFDPALPPCQADADVAQQTIAERADTTGADEFTVIAWNPHGWNVTSWLSLPVSGSSYAVTDQSTMDRSIDAAANQLL